MHQNRVRHPANRLFGGQQKPQMQHRIEDADGFGVDGFAPLVRSGQDIDSRRFVEGQVVLHDCGRARRRQRKNRVIQPGHAVALPEGGFAQGKSVLFQLRERRHARNDEPPFLEQRQQRLQPFHGESLDRRRTMLQGSGKNLVDCGIDGHADRTQLLVAQPTVNRDQRRKAVVRSVVVELHPKNPIQQVPRYVAFVVHGDQPGFNRAQLCVQIDPDGDAFDMRDGGNP